MDRLRGSSHQRKEDHHELQIGRLKQDRVHIPREGDVSPRNSRKTHHVVSNLCF